MDKGIEGEITGDYDGADSKENKEKSELDAVKILEEDEVDDDDSGINSSSHGPPSSKKSSRMRAATAELLQLLFKPCITFTTEEFNDRQPSSSTRVYYNSVFARQVFRTKLITVEDSDRNHGP